MRLETYLTQNRTQILELVVHVADSLANEEDTPTMRRGLVQSAYKAVRMAVANMLADGEEPGLYYGFHDGLAACVRRPEIGRDLFGGFAVSCGLLMHGGMLPCPDDWPSTRLALPPFIRGLLGACWRPQVESRLVEATKSGRVSLGEGAAGRRYVVEVLPDGEMWWRPVGA